MNDLSAFDFIDVHYHANPDLFERRHSALEVGRIYKKHNGVVVLKSHLGSTAVHAMLAQAEGLPVLPSVVLNDVSGGFDYRVVVRALLEYKPLIESRMLVHLPTITGRPHQSKLVRKLSNASYQNIAQKPLTVFDEHNALKAEVKALIHLCAQEPVVLSTGHASRDEVYALAEEISRYPYLKWMLNQPANPLTGLCAQELLELSEIPQLYIEQTALTFILGYQDESDFKKVLMTVPKVVYSSDLGQTDQIDVEEYLQLSKNYFKQFHLTTEREEWIWKKNPLNMLCF